MRVFLARRPIPGRSRDSGSNGKKIAADKASVAVTERGFMNVDIQIRTNVPHIVAIVGQPMLAHKAMHETHMVTEEIAGELQGLYAVLW
jgi:dihydrolipoamide dehydrogenase